MLQSVLEAVLRRTLRVLFRGMIGLNAPESFQRAWIQVVARTTLVARGTRLEPVRNPVPGVWVRSDAGSEAGAILYLHGGGYTLGSHDTHRAITSHLARAAQASVFALNYRLAPEHPYPAALDDAMAAYRELLTRDPASRIAVAGDSAGGGLALCLAIAIREARLPAPAALILVSPWLDLTLSGESVERLADVDPMLARSWLQRASDAYRGALKADDPRVSPLNADLHDLPPTLLQVGSDEILLSDAERFAERARAAGTKVTLECEAGHWHDFQLHAGVLDVADAAIARMAAFVHAAWAAASSSTVPSESAAA